MVGSQIITAGALFFQLNSKIDGLSRAISELKVEQAKIEGRLGSLEQTVRFILDCFPKRKVSIHSADS
jgi:hypothetical protein